MNSSRKNPNLYISATFQPKAKIVDLKIDCGLPLVIKSLSGTKAAVNLNDLHKSVHGTSKPLRKSAKLVVMR